MRKSKESAYTLINFHNISAQTIQNMRVGKGITTAKIDDLCKILNCRVEDIIVYENDADVSSDE